jgi:ribosomal protein L37AE/L43A
MSQHFLLSAKARTLSLAAIMRMDDDTARATFQAIRWADNGGEPYCPKCECQIVYPIATRHLWKCRDCRYQFSVTSRTIFSSRKLPVRDYLAAIAIFVNAVKGISALQLGGSGSVSGMRLARRLTRGMTSYMMAHHAQSTPPFGIKEAAGAVAVAV